jgi:hypothetical protein
LLATTGSRPSSAAWNTIISSGWAKPFRFWCGSEGRTLIVTGPDADGPRLLNRIRVVVDKTELRAVPTDFRLTPGMGFSAEIMVGDRRAITYHLYPLIRSSDETMQEP